PVITIPSAPVMTIPSAPVITIPLAFVFRKLSAPVMTMPSAPVITMPSAPVITIPLVEEISRPAMTGDTNTSPIKARATACLNLRTDGWRRNFLLSKLSPQSGLSAQQLTIGRDQCQYLGLLSTLVGAPPAWFVFLAEQPTELSKVCRYSSWPAACFCCVNLVIFE